MVQRSSRMTLAEVAEHAGVSVPTVSKVLNGRDDVAEPTRDRVQQAILELGYESPTQRRSSGQAPALIDLVIHRLDSAYSVEVMKGIIDLAAEENVEIVISSVPSQRVSQSDGRRWARRLRAAGRRGLILVTSEVDTAQLTALRNSGISVVLIDPFSAPQKDVATVGATNWAGGRGAVEHLLGLGHRRIAYIGGPENAECVQERLHGYSAALGDARLEVDPALIRFGPFDTENGAAALGALLELPDPPTAIFAANDTLALGVIAEAHARGLRIPRDLSVVGFDGTPIVEQSVPRLTSVAQPLAEIGRAALRSVLRLAQGVTTDSLHVELATTLVVRDSTAVAPG